MILNRASFTYKNKTLIEKVLISPPFRYEAIFQDEGCFVHIKGGNTKILSAAEDVHLNNQEAVLFNCGSYLVDWLKQINDSQIEVLAVHLYPDVLRSLYEKELPKTIQFQHQNNKTKRIVPDATLSKFIESLDFYFENPSLINDDLLELKVKELILLLIQTKSQSSIVELFKNLFSPRILDIRNVVSQHLYSNVSIQELAVLCNMGLSSFKREFKNEFNTSPLNYINTQRIEKAKELLSISNLPISEISYTVGFNDPLYFTRMFKKKEDLTPSEFRAKNKK